ncbi:MAG: class I SAM-dependent methyltransferase [Clostridia bacterium]|nr:class I SAM-dependent methyltransferase [Deltaproteobacteria bacterium]
MSAFDYSEIPVGFYDRVARGGGNAIRRAWHLQKFHRIRDCLPGHGGLSILDVGCFAGTFLSLLDATNFSRQVGVDILPEQVAYANAHYGNAHRRFIAIEDVTQIHELGETFDCVTAIEVIEHLHADVIENLMANVAATLEPNGYFVMSTPNYASAWPLVELVLNRVSDVSYEEQHVTKLNAFNLETKLARISPSFARYFRLEMKTTTHFVTPFLAPLGFDTVMRVAAAVPHKRWRMPFGNLCLAVFRRTTEAL